MNTKWEEDLAKTLMEITAKYQTWNYAMNLYHPLKDFIKDQITKSQQEIAEQIIEGIPHSLGGVEGESVYAFQLTKLKEKLRKKYIKKKSIT